MISSFPKQDPQSSQHQFSLSPGSTFFIKRNFDIQLRQQQTICSAQIMQ